MARRKTAKDAADMLLGGAENASDDEVGSQVEEGKTGDYEVEKIIADRWKEHRQEYLVKWFGFNKKSDNTWEPVDNLHACPEILQAYLAEKKSKKTAKPAATAAVTSTAKAGTSTARRGAEKTKPSGKTAPSTRPTRSSYLEASDDDEDDKFSAPDDRSTYSRNEASGATNGARGGRGNGGSRSQGQKKPAAKPITNALDESDDDDLPLAVARGSDSRSRQSSANLRSSKGRLSVGAASAADGYESDELGAPPKRQKPTGSGTKAPKEAMSARSNKDVVSNGLPGDDDESDEMEAPPKRRKAAGSVNRARKASPKATTSERPAVLDASEEEHEKERETSVNARGTGYRQAKVKAASAMKATPQKKTPPPKKAKKEASPEDGPEEEGEYVVERILGSLIGEGKLWYLVKWEGYDELKDNTWEPAKNLSHAKKVIADFTLQYGKPNHKKLKILSKEGEEYEKEFPPQEAEE